MIVSNRVAAVAVMVALFLMGAVAGGITMSFLWRGVPMPPPGWESSDRPPRRGGPDGPGGAPGPRGVMPAAFLDRLDRNLKLTDAQRDSAEAIMTHQREQAAATMREMAPRLRAGVDSTHAQIRRVLDEAQRERFDSLMQRDQGALGRRWMDGRRRGGGS